MVRSKPQRIAILIGSILLGVLATYLIYEYMGKPFLDIFKNPIKTKIWVAEHGAWSRIIFVLGCALQVVIAVIPGGPFEIGAGFAFGKLEGTILAMVGLTLGSLIVVLLVKKYGMKFICLFFPEEKVRSLRIFRNPKKLQIFTFILFLIPGTPKDFLTYVGGLTPISVTRWMTLTTLARLPSVVISVVGGAALYGKKYLFVTIITVIGIVCSVIGYAVFNKLNKLPPMRFVKKPSGERLFNEVNPADMKLERLPSKGAFSKLCCPLKIKV